MLTLAGATVIETKVRGSTVRLVLPVMPSNTAVIEVVPLPAAAPVARPCAEIVATAVFEDAHVTLVVMS